MTTPQMSQQELDNMRRLYQNLLGLLQEGQFPGKFAPHLAEAQAFITNMVEKFNQTLDKEEPKDGKPKRSRKKK